MTEIRLFTPGPTPVPEEIRKAGAQPMLHHRSEEFGAILKSVRERLHWLCDTDGEVLVFSSSGTGGMEAVIASLFSPGDEVVIVEGGKFGERWIELAKHYQLHANVVSVEWSKAVSADAVMRAVTPKTRGVLIQACESSTGAFHPVSAIGHALKSRPDIFFVVDAITALGVHDLSMRRDRIDALICASQKALMCPPGLATVALSAKTVVAAQMQQSRSYYFSLTRELKAQMKGQTGFTPAVSLLLSLDKALGMIETEGKDALFKRTWQLQRMAREAFRADGLKLFNSDADATAGITVVCAPEGLDVKAWLKGLRKTDGLWLAGGQGSMEGKIFRISHMGACWPKDLLWAIETIERSLGDLLPAAKEHKGLAVALKIAAEATK